MQRYSSGRRCATAAAATDFFAASFGPGTGTGTGAGIGTAGTGIAGTGIAGTGTGTDEDEDCGEEMSAHSAKRARFATPPTASVGGRAPPELS